MEAKERDLDDSDVNKIQALAVRTAYLPYSKSVIYAVPCQIMI